MSHICHRCSATIEDNSLFCPQCGAPQIRVPAAEPVLPPIPPGTPGDVQPPAVPVFPPLPPPTSVDWKKGLPATIMAGGLMALFNTFLAYGGLLLLPWTVLGGMAAVWFYQRRTNQAIVTPGMGARLGVVTGLTGFAIYSVLLGGLIAIQTFVFGKGGEIREAMRAALDQAVARNPSPEAQRIAEKLGTPEEMAMLITAVLVLLLFIFLILSTAGGSLGGALFGNRNRAR